MGLIFAIIWLVGWPIGLSFMFKKIGIAPWKAFIPFYNTWIMVEKCEIKKFWFWLQLIPFAGQFITLWISIIWVMNFGKYTLLDHTLTILVPFAYFPYLGTSKEVRWIGPERVKMYKKSGSREWIDAAVFAVVAATLIRTFLFEPFVIPTGSMEKTLLINDFLFVNKMSFGARIPETPISFPFVHNTMPGSQTTPSYIKWVKLPYWRLPAIHKVERNNVVVFNVPVGDTIINEANYGSAVLYYDVLREQYHGNREQLMADHNLWVHPMDKTDNYIKRCTAVPGDKLQLINGQLLINDKPALVPENSQYEYIVKTNGQPFNESFIKSLNINTDANDVENLDYYLMEGTTDHYYFNIRPKDLGLLKQQPNVVDVQPNLQTNPVWPYDAAHSKWTPDNFGPIVLPAKGATVTLTPDNIALYQRLITTYEKNTFLQNGAQFTINGKVTNQYTFKQDYYWMMGDNRHKSQDSRYWGFVPEQNIVGKATLIWFSYKNGPRWNRIFKSIQ